MKLLVILQLFDTVVFHTIHIQFHRHKLQHGGNFRPNFSRKNRNASISSEKTQKARSSLTIMRGVFQVEQQQDSFERKHCDCIRWAGSPESALLCGFCCFVTKPVYDPGPGFHCERTAWSKHKAPAIQTLHAVYSANSLCIVPGQLHDHPV